MTYPKVPTSSSDGAAHRRQIAEALNAALDGRLHSVSEVTLTASATTTTLSDYHIGTGSVILFMPTTANAAAELSALYVTGLGEQTATLNHNNLATVDRTFKYVVLG